MEMDRSENLFLSVPRWRLVRMIQISKSKNPPFFQSIVRNPLRADKYSLDDYGGRVERSSHVHAGMLPPLRLFAFTEEEKGEGGFSTSVLPFFSSLPQVNTAVGRRREEAG